jgi:hypothetical protein
MLVYSQAIWMVSNSLAVQPLETTNVISLGTCFKTGQAF